MVPGSPEDIRMPVIPSGVVSPMDCLSGVGTPVARIGTPMATPLGEKEVNPLSHDED